MTRPTRPATYRPLTGGWTVEPVSGPVPGELQGRRLPATVPGVVHTDLLAAQAIPDPYIDDHEARLSWIGRTTWRYTTTFTWDTGAAAEHDRHELVCDGLDTVATLEVNGTEVGRTVNQHRSYRFDVTDLLVDGANTVTVTFGSALDYAEQAARRSPRPHTNHHPYNAIRKMACNFGWDWGPDLVTAGIWRPIGIQSWSTARLAAVRPLVTEATAQRGTVVVHVDLACADDDAGELAVTARVGDATVTVSPAAGQHGVVVPVTLDSPRLWWPRGYGAQPLYPVEVTVSGPDGRLDSWHARVGFRTVTVDTGDDGSGSRFAVQVNGQDVFVRGANWIPDDAFPSRVDRSRYEQRIGDAAEAGANLLRVWGGGIYESDDFYDLCDERGILVWQDFLFSCAAYAEEALHDEVEAEAREAVTRLAAHPSLAVWNGNNENLWGHASWGWQQELGELSWGTGFYHDLLPRIVSELDPTRPYIPGSPYSPNPLEHPNNPETGPVHIWDVWNDKDYRHYGDYTPRFVAEFGFQGPPAWSTLTEAVHDSPLTPHSPVMLVHQKAANGNDKLQRGWSGHFPQPQTLTDWHWTTQLNQARAITFAVERFRSLAPYCQGTILWQLNDCWPVVSWAAVDGYGRRKPLWFALRRAYADRLLTVQRRDGRLAAVAINDAPQPYSGVLRARRVGFDGTVLAERSAAFDVAARDTAVRTLHADIAEPHDPSSELIVVDVRGDGSWHRSEWFFAEDLDLALPSPRFDATVTRAGDGVVVDVRAKCLLRDVTVFADRLDPGANVSDQLATLLPGERASFTITTPQALSADDILAPPVLRTANDLVSATSPASTAVTRD